VEALPSSVPSAGVIPGTPPAFDGCVFRDRKRSVTSLPPTWNFHCFSIRGAAHGVVGKSIASARLNAIDASPLPQLLSVCVQRRCSTSHPRRSQCWKGERSVTSYV
jgi:hypothetical protein